MRVSKEEVRSAIGWTLVAVTVFALSVWMMKADAEGLPASECASWSHLATVAVGERDKGVPEYVEQSLVAFSAGLKGDVPYMLIARGMIHQIYTVVLTPEETARRVNDACLTRWGDQK